MITSGGKSVAKYKDSVDHFHDFPSPESHHIERKRQMDHELSMAHAANKNLKYELRLKKIEGEIRLAKGLRLQVELEPLRRFPAHPVLDRCSQYIFRVKAPQTEPQYKEFPKTPQYRFQLLLPLAQYLLPTLFKKELIHRQIYTIFRGPHLIFRFHPLLQTSPLSAALHFVPLPHRTENLLNNKPPSSTHRMTRVYAELPST